MTNAYSFDGIIIATLLFVCASAYMKRVPRLRAIFCSEKRGFWGTFYKGAVIGIRLHWLVASACLIMAFYVILPPSLFRF